MRLDYCVVLVVGLFLESCVGLDNITTVPGCDQPACVRCGASGCTRCALLIVHPSRLCVDGCPFGHVEAWSTWAGYVGRVCRPNGRPLGLPADALAALAGVLAGFVVCAAVLAAAVLWARWRRRKRRAAGSEAGSEVDDGSERRDFLKRLETLRPHAPAFLDLLNDARRQIRTLHAAGDGAAAIAAYRPAVRDLAKVLLLLNKRAEPPAPPEDWERLLGWAEQALGRYRRMIGPPPSPSPQPSPRASTAMSTFKPDRVDGSLQDLAVLNFNANYDSRGCHLLPVGPQWKFEYSLVGGGAPASEFDAGWWRNSREGVGGSLFLEDDFCQLGFRPQDEITTEL